MAEFSLVNRELASRIYKLRTERGLRQIDLELEAGLALGYLSRIENGQQNITLKSLVKIAETLNLRLTIDLDGH